MDGEAFLTLLVTPEPALDELEALTAALAAMVVGRAPRTATASPQSDVSRWARAGRQAARRGLADRPTNGWGALRERQ